MKRRTDGTAVRKSSSEEFSFKVRENEKREEQEQEQVEEKRTE